MRRTAIFTVLLCALGGGVTVAGAAGLFGAVELQRRVVLWGLPLAAAALAAWCGRGGAAGRAPSLRLAGLAAALLAFAADQSFLAVTYATRSATFTYGAQELAGGGLARAALWALPACLVLGVAGWERALRGCVYAGWSRRLSAPAAAALSALAGTALALPAILPEGQVRDPAFVAASLAATVCRELTLVLLFARGGGLVVAGLYRGLLVFTEAFVINDWYSLYFPAANYVADGPSFYVARAATAALALGLVAALLGRRRQVAA